MVRWRPWPPLLSRKLQVRLVVRRIEGVSADGAGRVAAEVTWKGPKAALGSLWKTVRRNRTREEAVREGGVVEWNEEFEAVCNLTAHRGNAFHPWEIAFAVLNDLKLGPKNKESLIGVALLNLTEFLSAAEDMIEINLPLLLPGASVDNSPSIHLALKLLEFRASQDSSDTMQRPISLPTLEPPSSGDAIPSRKDEFSNLKAGLQKVKLLTDLVSTKKSKKTSQDDDSSEGRSSAKSDDTENAYPFDTDSHDEDLDEDSEDNKEDSNVRKSFSYDKLASANCVGGSFYSGRRIDGEYDDWIYYSHRRSDVGYSHKEETRSFVAQQCIPLPHPSRRSILPWRKRKLSFRSLKFKGEPLLKKAYAEEGGDDIDYDRRMLSSSDESLFSGSYEGDGSVMTRSSESEFGDDNFVIGNWEFKELVSRDGLMKLSTRVFFASIDQRSEQAAGESACTALVAVIADWFQKNQDLMPIKSEFDSLIREGSLQWRNLCENQMYQELFPDKHFDLETILQAKICQLSVVPRKSFIGFFHPEDASGNSDFDFLHGAMSFDNIWDEISQFDLVCTSNGSPHIFIVSWNDHFFILKVERDAYYIIDTLGERLYEGCNQAYILKFDESTTIHKTPTKTTNSEATGPGNATAESSIRAKDKGISTMEENLVCKGKESCMEYIKSFLAAIPIRQLQDDIKKGRTSSTPLHHRLQIEFQYVECLKDDSFAALSPATEAIPDSEFSWPGEPNVAFNPLTAVVVV